MYSFYVKLYPILPSHPRFGVQIDGGGWMHWSIGAGYLATATSWRSEVIFWKLEWKRIRWTDQIKDLSNIIYHLLNIRSPSVLDVGRDGWYLYLHVYICLENIHIYFQEVQQHDGDGWNMDMTSIFVCTCGEVNICRKIFQIFWFLIHSICFIHIMHTRTLIDTHWSYPYDISPC